jgi:tetratricopeptide (TPR) repeat protein
LDEFATSLQQSVERFSPGFSSEEKPAGCILPRKVQPGSRAFLSHLGRAFLIFLALSGLALSVDAESGGGRDAQTSYDRALRAFNAEKLEDAQKLAAAAEGANPRKPEIANLRGAIFTKQKRYDEAVEQFKAALRLDANFYQARLNLAEVYLRQGKYTEAAQGYQEMQKLDPESELLQFKLILCALLSGDIDRASAMADVMKFPGKTPAYYFARAIIALKRGNKESCQKYLDTVKKYYPEEQCAYFVRSLKDLDLIDIPKTEPAKPQNQSLTP